MLYVSISVQFLSEYLDGKSDSQDLNPTISFERIHIMNNRATPEKFLMYKHALALYRIYNSNKPSLEWCALNFNQILTSKQTNFKFAKTNRLKVANSCGYQ